MSLELSGPEASRPYIEAARPEHPSLLDPTHLLDELFGVVNIPNVIWIDEAGTIVRPPEPGWPDVDRIPDFSRPRPRPTGESRPDRTPEEQAAADRRSKMMSVIATGQDRAGYADALRDWVGKGADSAYVMSPDQVIAASQPRPKSVSLGAAHFAMGNHLWRAGDRERAVVHFNAANNLQPGNWTYKRQAWSLVGNERVGGERGRFNQGPLPGEEAEWPFDSDFMSDVLDLDEGQYYPKTL